MVIGDTLGRILIGGEVVPERMLNCSKPGFPGMCLIRGADSGNVAEVRSAIGSGGCPDQRTWTDETPLIIAARAFL